MFTFDGKSARHGPLSRIRLLLGISLVVVLVSALALPWAGAVPPGNNGTVKIDGDPFDDHPNNEPHVGCVFQVDFYGYDEGDLSAVVTFRAHPPTGTAVLLTDEVFIGEDPAGGGTDLDASETYDLTAALAGFEPHPVQGFHVKLTVNAEGSQGADVKHKVFWVTCEKPPPTTSTSSTTSTTKPDKPGTIIIEKYAAPFGDQPFTFGGDLGTFVIVDDELGTGNPGSQHTVSGLDADSYTIFEEPVAGWNLVSIACQRTVGSASTFTVTLAARSVTINLVAGETVYCDFQNRKPY